MLATRGESELAHFAETLSFRSKVNTRGNLRYGEDYDVGDRVTCINRRWGVSIDVRITEAKETFQAGINELEITFGESLPTLADAMRQIAK
jgi:hypothetical protein